jgi:hypothetical protein
MGCAHSMHVEMRNTYKVLVGNFETGDIEPRNRRE